MTSFKISLQYKDLSIQRNCTACHNRICLDILYLKLEEYYQNEFQNYKLVHLSCLNELPESIKIMNVRDIRGYMNLPKQDQIHVQQTFKRLNQRDGRQVIDQSPSISKSKNRYIYEKNRSPSKVILRSSIQKKKSQDKLQKMVKNIEPEVYLYNYNLQIDLSEVEDQTSLEMYEIL